MDRYLTGGSGFTGDLKTEVRTMTFLLIAVVVAPVLAVLVTREVRHDHPRTAPASFHSDTGAPEEQLEHV